MKTVELFSGTGSFSKVAKNLGHDIFRVEINPDFEAELTKDILEVQDHDLPKNIDVLWASPPCTTFSVASLRHYWVNKKPKNAKTWQGICYVLKTLKLIEELKPRYWFIENPRGMLRKQDFIKKLHRKTITYCQYGDFRMKPTDIFTNFNKWNPKPKCSPGDNCHQSARRGEDRGTQSIGGGGKEGAKLRSVIPKQLFEEIFNQIQLKEINNNG